MTEITKEQRAKIVKFLGTLDSHTVYSYTETAARFLKETGLKAPWGYCTVSAMRAQMERRPAGGWVKANSPKEKLCSGYAMAESCADEWGEGDALPLFGLGSRFRDAIRRIEEKGKA